MTVRPQLIAILILALILLYLSGCARTTTLQDTIDKGIDCEINNACYGVLV